MSKARTPQDSLKYFLNIFDLSRNDERDVFRDSIIGTATRAGNMDGRLELIKLYAAYMQPPEVMDELIGLALASPESESKNETVAFAKMRKITLESRSNETAALESELQDILSEMENNLSDDIYERIVQRHKVCVYLGNALRGNALRNYFNDYLEDISKLPEYAYSIRTAAYVQGCLIFLDNEDFSEAVKYNKKMLSVIEELEKTNRTKERPYRNYDDAKYIRNTSLLACFPVLSKEELQKYYAETLRLAENNNEVREKLEQTKTPMIYYYYATGEYQRALDLLKQVIGEYEHQRNERRLFELMIVSASKVGDTATLDMISKKYINLIKELIADRSYETYRKLQIQMDISSILQEKKQLIEEIHTRELDKKNNQIIFFSSILSVLAIVLVVVLILYRKNNKLANQLKVTNQNLEKERDALAKAKEELLKNKEEYEYENLVKTNFIVGISETVRQPMIAVIENSRLIVDCADNSSRPYLQKFANLVEQNVKVLRTTIRDIFTLAELHSSNIQLSYSGTSVNRICHGVISTFSKQIQPDVELIFSPQNDADDPIINTDAQRVEQILIQLLSNASKFTEQGSIELSYVMNRKKQTITFVVTDTGIGIPDNMADKIFERYYKGNRHEPGLGIGLTIAKSLAELLRGTLELDTSYKYGARFVLTIPCV